MGQRPRRATDAKEDEDTIHVAMAELGEVSAVNFHRNGFFDGPKAAEIAKAMKMTPSQVSQRSIDAEEARGLTNAVAKIS